MLFIVESGELVELTLHLLTWDVRTRNFGVKERKGRQRTVTGMMASWAVREEYGQKLCCKTITVSLCSAASPGPMRS
jgi:hypothetical protein